jgi:hypothetical protein
VPYAKDEDTQQIVAGLLIQNSNQCAGVNKIKERLQIKRKNVHRVKAHKNLLEMQVCGPYSSLHPPTMLIYVGIQIQEPLAI